MKFYYYYKGLKMKKEREKPIRQYFALSGNLFFNHHFNTQKIEIALLHGCYQTLLVFFYSIFLPINFLFFFLNLFSKELLIRERRR